MDAPNLILMLYILVLAVFIGFEVISKVPSTLHTPLMSGSNAISGITILGALALTGQESLRFSPIVVGLAFVALVFATINVFGGYLVTARMLEMFKKKKNTDKGEQ